MSGTSLDGVDAVLVDFQTDATPRVLGHHFLPFPSDFKLELLALNQGCSDELHRSALAANQVSRLYAECTLALLKSSQHTPEQINALGAHGQTVRHQPAQHDAWGYTTQLLNPALLAELTQIDVVSDFRARDVASGGQGAPLVPAFHQAIFTQATHAVAVFNLGGMSNVSWLPPAQKHEDLQGFDCGPGNVLMDLWCKRHLGEDFDRNGAWSQQGHVNAELLHDFLQEPFFKQAPPKSTGRDLFHSLWLDEQLNRFWTQSGSTLKNEDIQATLCALTAEACLQSLNWIQAQTPHEPLGLGDVVLCGGGALNHALVTEFESRIRQKWPHQPIRLLTTNDLGWPVDQIEASAFAWLAKQHVLRGFGNVPKVTGANGHRVLGSLTPA
jgi:anhydro-N-acetylmuramic acid kinase